MALLILESANLFTGGDQDPTRSNHLRLQELKLPEINENYVEHAPGGARVAISVDTHIEPLEATFTLTGWQPEIYSLLKRETTQHERQAGVYVSQGLYQSTIGQTTFTAYGLLRERGRGCAMEAMAVMRGLLGRINPTPFHRGELHHHEYAIRAITQYRLRVAGTEVFAWDFFDKQHPRVIESADTRTFLQAMLR